MFIRPCSCSCVSFFFCQWLVDRIKMSTFPVVMTTHHEYFFYLFCPPCKFSMAIILFYVVYDEILWIMQTFIKSFYCILFDWLRRQLIRSMNKVIRWSIAMCILSRALSFWMAYVFSTFFIFLTLFLRLICPLRIVHWFISHPNHRQGGNHSRIFFFSFLLRRVTAFIILIFFFLFENIINIKIC